MSKRGAFIAIKKTRENLKFIDINTPNLSLELECGINYRQEKKRSYGIKNDGSLIKDIKQFQEAFIWFT